MAAAFVVIASTSSAAAAGGPWSYKIPLEPKKATPHTAEPPKNKSPAAVATRPAGSDIRIGTPDRIRTCDP